MSEPESTERSGRDSPALMLALLGADAARRLRAAHADAGLSPRQLQLMGMLGEQGPLPQSDLAAALDVASSILVGLLNPLEIAGWIRRERDAQDRRRHVVRLTEAGSAQLRSASEGQREVEESLLGSLSPAEQRQLTSLLSSVRDGLTGGDPNCATPASLERVHQQDG